MKEVLRQIGMTLVEVAIFLGITFLTFGVVGGIMVRFGVVDISEFSTGAGIDPYSTLLVDFLPVFIGTIIATVAVHHFIFKRSYAFSGFSPVGGVRQFFIGVIWAIALLTVGFLILLALGMIKVTGVDANLYLFVGFMLLFIFQSSFEEFAMRSFLLPTVAHRFNIYWGLLVSSLVFTLLHMSNSHLGIIPLLNLFLAGVFLGMLFLRYKTIWAPIGMHFAWNFFQGSFLGFEVSGIDVYSYLQSVTSGSDIMTGGEFGFEGSILASILLAGSMYLIWHRNRQIFAQPIYQPLEMA